MLLPPTSAPPISQHCPAERPALHSVRRARPMQLCPATASCGRSWRQPAPSTGSSCSARCSPPNQRYNWIANKLTSPFPKIYTPKGKIRRASTNSNRLGLVIHGPTIIVNVLMHISRLESMEGREEHPKLWKKRRQPKCTQTFQTQTSRVYWLSMRACGWA